jgi:hypothetical protein
MNTKLTSSLMAAAGVAMIFSLLAVGPAFAASTTVQSFTTPTLNGWYNQVPYNGNNGPATMNLAGNIQTNGNGEMNLSPLKGNVTFNGATYDLQVKPTGKVTTQTDSWGGCYTSTSYVQTGTAKLTGNNGKAVFGQVIMYWGSSQYNCWGYNYSYSYTGTQLTTQDTTGTIYSIGTYANTQPTIQ